MTQELRMIFGQQVVTKSVQQQHEEDSGTVVLLVLVYTRTRKRLRNIPLPPWTTGGRGVRRTGARSAKALHPTVAGTTENTTEGCR